jgi:hypothetical protein
MKSLKVLLLALVLVGICSLSFAQTAYFQWPSLPVTSGPISAMGDTTLPLGLPAWSPTAPTIASGFGTSPSIVKANGTAIFTINVGSGGSASNGAITLPTAPNGWDCRCTDQVTQANGWMIRASATSVTSVTLTNYSGVTPTAWTANDVLGCACLAY